MMFDLSARVTRMMIDSFLDFMILDSLIRMMIDCLNNMMQYLMFDSMKSESSEILEIV
jgi:hypothetical protein